MVKEKLEECKVHINFSYVQFCALYAPSVCLGYKNSGEEPSYNEVEERADVQARANNQDTPLREVVQRGSQVRTTLVLA